MHKLKQDLINTIDDQIRTGQALLSETLKSINSSELDKILADYEQWDELNKTILKNGFTQQMQQFFRMYPEYGYLGHSEIKPNSFEDKRTKLNTNIPKKIAVLTTTLGQVKMLDVIYILPLDEHLAAMKPITLTADKIINYMKKIFLSHSSKDKDKIDLFRDLIEDIGIKHSEIFYSSGAGYGVTLGKNLFEELKKELNSESFVIFFLSDNFFNSPVCMCEMGATWILSKTHIPVLIPPFNFSNVKGVFPNDIGCYINDKDQLNELKGLIEKEFGINPPIPISRWEQKRDEYLIAVNKLLV